MDVTAERCLRKLNDLLQSLRRLNVNSVYQYSLVDTRDSINDVHCSVQFSSQVQSKDLPTQSLATYTMPRRKQGHKGQVLNGVGASAHVVAPAMPHCIR